MKHFFDIINIFCRFFIGIWHSVCKVGVYFYGHLAALGPGLGSATAAAYGIGMAAPTRSGSRHVCAARRVREIMTAVCDIHHLIILSQLKTYTKFEKRQNRGARRDDLFPFF